MKKRLLLCCFTLISLLLISCKKKEETPYVMMISFDGFRYDYIAKHHMPHFEDFVSQGTQAEGLLSSFPSKTFPNHYTLVTGMYPGHHGLVDNSFYDPRSQQEYTMKDRAAVENPVYYGGTPLWQLAQQQGLSAASYFWVGSETAIQGMHPDQYFRYDESVPNKSRVDQAIEWLQLPEDKRPHLITLYFSMVDTQGHKYGPNSKELAEALQESDQLLGYLMDKLDKVDLPVNVVLVSDHGMLEMKNIPDAYVYLSELMSMEDSTYQIVNGGTQAHIYTKKAAVRDSLYKILKAREKHFTIYQREDFPARWHYDHARSGDLLLTVDPGYYLTGAKRSTVEAALNKPESIGKHGYDPDKVKEMTGIFYAKGPNISKGKTIPAFRNIHVYPFIARVLGLHTPEHIDGDAAVLEKVYVDRNR